MSEQEQPTVIGHDGLRRPGVEVDTEGCPYTECRIRKMCTRPTVCLRTEALAAAAAEPRDEIDEGTLSAMLGIPVEILRGEVGPNEQAMLDAVARQTAETDRLARVLQHAWEHQPPGTTYGTVFEHMARAVVAWCEPGPSDGMVSDLVSKAIDPSRPRVRLTGDQVGDWVRNLPRDSDGLTEADARASDLDDTLVRLRLLAGIDDASAVDCIAAIEGRLAAGAEMIRAADASLETARRRLEEMTASRDDIDGQLQAALQERDTRPNPSWALEGTATGALHRKRMRDALDAWDRTSGTSDGASAVAREQGARDDLARLAAKIRAVVAEHVEATGYHPSNADEDEAEDNVLRLDLGLHEVIAQRDRAVRLHRRALAVNRGLRAKTKRKVRR